jgi:hypothetical protein
MKLGFDLADMLGCNRVILSSDNHDVTLIMGEGGYSSSVAAATFENCYHATTEVAKVEYEHVNGEDNLFAPE